MATSKKQKTVVVGAGPVGSLAALYAAKRGDDVELYELRGDLRDPSTTPLNFTKSINLALSERGINSMKKADCPGLLESVLNETIPMHGRMIHGQKHGNLFQEPQLYDVHGRFVRAVDRAGLNKSLLDELEKMPNVKFFFNHKLTGADFRKNLAWFERQGILRSDIAQKPTQQPADKRGTEIEVKFDFMIGADGAHSAVRYHLMKYTRMSYQQEYIDALWCEFHISPTKDNDFMLPPNYLHIWSGEEFMFIAIPSLDKSFTSTLFLPNTRFAELDANQSSLTDFFKLNFPGVIPNIISEAELHKQYSGNLHLPLISIKCTPYHYGSSAVILGDAAHAMVPFYGQGMNAGLEDVRVLFDILDEYSVGPQNSDTIRENRAKALEEYTKQRTPDAVSINDLALRNYQEMRSDVRSPMYRLRKWTEEKLDAYLPSLGWATQYSRVSFGNNRYSEVEKAARRQGRILLGVMGLSLVSAFGLGSLWLSRLNLKFPPRKFLSQWFHHLFSKLAELKSRWAL